MDAVVTQDVTAQDVVLVQQDLLLVESGKGGLDLLHGDTLPCRQVVLARLEGVEEVLDAVVQRGAGDVDVFAQAHLNGAVLHHHGQVHLVQGLFPVHQLEKQGIGTADAVGHREAEVAAVQGGAVHAVAVQVGQVGHVIFRHRNMSRQGAAFGGILRAAGSRQKDQDRRSAKQTLFSHRMNDK